jgi:hypothetical protein
MSITPTAGERDGEQVGALRHRRADEQPAVGAAADRELLRRGVLLRHEVPSAAR